MIWKRLNIEAQYPHDAKRTQDRQRPGGRIEQVPAFFEKPRPVDAQLQEQFESKNPQGGRVDDNSLTVHGSGPRYARSTCTRA